MLFLTGCDYLNRVPEKDIETVNRFSSNGRKPNLGGKGCMEKVATELLTSLTNNTSFLGADEFVTCRACTIQLHSVLTGWRWRMVCRCRKVLTVVVVQDVHGYPECEYFSGKTIDTQYYRRRPGMVEKRREGFESVYLFWVGSSLQRPICLVPQNMPMELDVSAYQLPRQHVDTCFKEIVRLLDEAAPYIDA